ncbi:hypothetical protein HU200_061147 [Digitaria exilis]|uniref:Uncharacterized protein n=1 Tax=Digitaria exilis TaxID=1010633 RepID=A0A835DY82_9POAL|nr:hypothetical protein HU200_061147 [Digitaria exilis]
MRTTSRCSPQTARGTHAFEVAGYSLHRGLGSGHFIRSAAFDVGGYRWCIRFYPDGYVNDDDVEDSSDNDMVAVFLELLSVDAVVRAHYDFRLLDHATGEENAYAWGTDEFMERSELEASSYLLDDRLVVECDVTVIEEALVEVLEDDTVTSSSRHGVELPSKDLSRSLGKLLEMKEQADVIFKVEDKVFHAHKLVLAVRSPNFVSQDQPDGLLEGMKRGNIEIEDMQPAVFKALLHFVYTDTLPAMEGLYGDELKVMCEGILCRGPGPAQQHHCCHSNFKRACAEHVVNPSTRVGGAKPSCQTRSWVHIFSYLWEKACGWGISSGSWNTKRS